MTLKTAFYFAPVVPLVGRSLITARFRRYMRRGMKEEVAAREVHRSFILALGGFSFSGLLAIAVIDASVQQNLQLSVYYLLISFLSYLFALNLQSYKSHWWHDQLGDLLIEAATLSLLLSVVAIIWSSKQPDTFKYLVTCLAVAVWLLDHLIRIRLLWKYFKQREANDGQGQR
ncbi:MAG: hypothetical protein LC800_07215 [Acidobacteria bacterium]|nr:hypothetical protein [Acidobacteriota bacterium]